VSLVAPLPSPFPKDRVASELDRFDDWFYEFKFSNGAETRAVHPDLPATHEARAELVFPYLDEVFGDRWAEIDCLDMACHQGWFAIQAALRGARRVFGVDIREEHVARARLVAELTGVQATRFERRNLYDLAPATDGVFDLTLFLGILYHLEDPVGALKVARALTRGLCVIETQVARPAPDLTFMWGPDPTPRHGHAIAVGRVDEHHVAEGGSVVLVPTLEALYALLRGVGFSRIELAEPPAGIQEQFARRDRVVVFAAP
jgi:tRNA (mo5U34)-methyltransferase